MTEDEPRYTPDEVFDRDVDFLKVEHARLETHGIRTWEHEAWLQRCMASLKNRDVRIIKGMSERRTSDIFGEPGDGTLFQMP